MLFSNQNKVWEQNQGGKCLWAGSIKDYPGSINLHKILDSTEERNHNLLLSLKSDLHAITKSGPI